MNFSLNLIHNEVVLGLMVSQIMSIGQKSMRLTKSFGDLSDYITLVQRVREYIEDEEHEGGDWNKEDLNDSRFENTLVNSASIEFRNVKVRYREGLPLVLKGISFKIEPGQKVGIVGRTGCGKSTLMLCLMRMLELEREEGEDNLILINGVDISGLSLKLLRGSITIIPQDPYLLGGSLRYSIDPFGVYSDAEILESVKRVDFISTLKNIRRSPKKTAESTNRVISDQYSSKVLQELSLSDSSSNLEILETQIEPQGSNLSQGQRQLLCIARALLRKPNILLMDEATASIDNKRDHLLQTIFHQELRDCTILTISHRVDTIKDYDRIIVIEDGLKVAEGSFEGLFG